MLNTLLLLFLMIPPIVVKETYFCAFFRMAIITPLIFAFRNRKHISATVTISLAINVLLSMLFIICRKTPGICEHMPTHEVSLGFKDCS